MKPPTANELVGPPPHGLDERWALRNFLGKTQEEAKRMCRNGSVAEDFTYMAPEGLCYYLPAALSFLESDEAQDSDFPIFLMCAFSTLVGIFGMRGEPLVIIRRIADYCDANRERLGLGSGDLFDEYLQTVRRASQ